MSRRRVAARSLPLGEHSIASCVLLTRSTVNLRDAYEVPVDKPYTLFRALDARGAVQPFRRDEQRLVQELAAQTTRLPGLTES